MGTTAHGYRYMDSTEFLATVHTKIKNLADDVESKVKTIQSGSVTVNIAIGSASGTATVTFPTPFTVAVPKIALSGGVTGNPYVVTRNGTSLTQVTVVVNRPSGASTAAAASLVVDWIAHG
ncbi:hypothetical protein [Aeromicrobium sp. 9AM]|uniref:gp53-like domain-containing protein n=1 Tax=Aeromicrobium sp. 9AM TaxID=2653126 RepID=UPI0012F46799|nr:hypothetical protein [Aeromicrobium sp. 9AM]VXC21524.1 hypothetical protein AERO9AM_50383 [Aeromicrobium sp. 9AM]